MAGQDELIYRVVYESDETSFKAVQTQLNALTQQTAQAVQKAQVQALKSGAGVQGLKEIEGIVKGAQAGTAGLVGLAKEINNTKLQLKDLATQSKKGNGLTEEQIAKQVDLKLALKLTEAEYKKQERGMVSLADAGVILENTYDSLVAQNKELAKELRGLDFDKDKTKILDLSMAYRQNNDKLKEFDANMGNHQRNVGDYKNQIISAAKGLTVMGVNVGDVAEQFNKAKGATGGAVTGLKSFSGGFSALNQVMKANVILLVVSAVIKLIDVFKQFDSVNHKIEVGMARLSGIMTGFMQTLSSGGGLGENIRKAGEAAEKILVVNKQLKKDETDLIMLRAESGRKIAELEEKAKQENRTLEERRSLLLEAKKLVNESAVKELKLVKDRIEITRLEVTEARKAGKETIELERTAAEARAQFDVVFEQSADKRKNIQKQIYALEDQETAKAKEKETARKQRLDERAKAELATAEMIRKINDEAHDVVIQQIAERAEAEQKALEESYTRESNLANLKRTLSEKRLEQQFVLADNAARTDEQLKANALSKQLALDKQYEEQRKQDRIRAALETGTDAQALAVKLELIDIDANAKKRQNAQNTANEITAIDENAANKRIAIAYMVADSISGIGAGLEAVGLISAKKAFNINKAVGAANATITGFESVNKAIAINPIPPYPLAILAGAAAFGNVAKILATPFNGGGGGNANTLASSVPSGGGMSAGLSINNVAANQIGASVTPITPNAAPTIIVNNTVDRAGIATLVREGNEEISARGLTVASV
jgi:hypothetical protein